jgi:hypothetical protein
MMATGTKEKPISNISVWTRSGLWIAMVVAPNPGATMVADSNRLQDLHMLVLTTPDSKLAAISAGGKKGCRSQLCRATRHP